MTHPAAPLLALRGLTKHFGAQAALQDVHLDVRPGEVHALVGENGAGKSTLIKVLTGVHPPDGGALLWDGAPVTFLSPRDAQARGIRALHQDRQLVPGFSVLENLYLGAPYPQRAGRVDWRAMRREAQAAQRQVGLSLPLDELAQHLTPTQRTLTELLRAVMVRGRLLILDEPTASLAHQDAETLFALIHRLRAEGAAVLYVSHRLEEVIELADHVTVLRGGQVAARFARGAANADELVAAMSGAALEGAPRPAPPPGGAAVLLTVEGLATRDGRVRDVSFELREREVLGIYGLAGAGRTELLEALAGLRARRAGRVRWPAGRPGRAALIPEDRRGQGLVGHMSVLENVTLSTLGQHARLGVLSGARERRALADATRALNIRAAAPGQPVGELSGGNQQKVVFARALQGRPDVWLCDEPTQAVDVMTRRAIHALLREQADAGVGVVLVTSDLTELLEVAGRVVVLREGRSVATLEGPALTAEAVLRACYQAPGGDAGDRRARV